MLWHSSALKIAVHKTLMEPSLKDVLKTITLTPLIRRNAGRKDNVEACHVDRSGDGGRSLAVEGSRVGFEGGYTGHK